MGSEEDLKDFLKTVNKLHPSIKFDYAYSRSKSIFLDCSVTIKDKKLKTSVYSKPTDRKAYVHSRSYHPSATKDAIAYGQAIRLRRICTEESDFVESTKKLESDLIKRGCAADKIKKDIEKAANMDPA